MPWPSKVPEASAAYAAPLARLALLFRTPRRLFELVHPSPLALQSDRAARLSADGRVAQIKEEETMARNAESFVEPYAVTQGTRFELDDHDPHESARS